MGEFSQGLPAVRADSGREEADCLLTVVVPTRNRGDLAARTVASILEGSERRIRLIVVDQSDAPDTKRALEPFQADARFRYVSSSSAGISAARNEGVALARTALIAHTDDDCEARPDWCRQVIDAFERFPQAELLFGTVEPGEHSMPDRGFIPSYLVHQERLIVGLRRKTETEGIGACMAYRRRLWDELAGFDESLGVGTPLGSAEDVDFAVRTLAAGHGVLETPQPRVVHYGFRTWEQANPLLRRYLYGIGAACAKQLRVQGVPFLAVLARLGLRWAFAQPVADFEHRPSRRLRLFAFARGFTAGFRMKIRGDFFTLTSAPPRPSPGPAPTSPLETDCTPK
ncbi:MAG: glycosyltransferase [Acidobacteria bacterium]|nr:glycosyltransferase [Acidobacteriota bacterium]